MAVYSRRCFDPMVPTTASPVLIPTPFLILPPSLASHFAETASVFSWKSSAVRTAFAA